MFLLAESVTNMLRSFTQADRDDMVEDGVISVTCEFCNSKYVFDPAEVATSEERRKKRKRLSQKPSFTCGGAFNGADLIAGPMAGSAPNPQSIPPHQEVWIPGSR